MAQATRGTRNYGDQVDPANEDDRAVGLWPNLRGQTLSRSRGETTRLAIDRKRERSLVSSLTNSYKYSGRVGMMKMVLFMMIKLRRASWERGVRLLSCIMRGTLSRIPKWGGCSNLRIGTCHATQALLMLVQRQTLRVSQRIAENSTTISYYDTPRCCQIGARFCYP